jgi:SEC-C motif-containing protein
MGDNGKVLFLHRKMPKPSPCPCGGPSFAACCEPYLSGAALAPSAEALMRSRYSAYVLRQEDYLRATWHPSTLPAEPILQDGDTIQWLGLEVKSSLRLRQRKASPPAFLPTILPNTPDADTVEFVARYRINGRGHRLHEVSRFVRQQGGDGGAARWYYLDGSFPE